MIRKLFRDNELRRIQIELSSRIGRVQILPGHLPVNVHPTRVFPRIWQARKTFADVIIGPLAQEVPMV